MFRKGKWIILNRKYFNSNSNWETVEAEVTENFWDKKLLENSDFIL